FKEGQLQAPARVRQQVLSYGCPLVEVTGGEPLLQEEVLPLMAQLAEDGLTVLLETSGAHPIDRVDRRVHVILDLKCPDSGECARNRGPNLDGLGRSGRVKFVVASRRDFDWAADVIRSRQLDRRFVVLLSPAFGLVEPIDLAGWLLQSRLNVRLQLQLHKYIW